MHATQISMSVLLVLMVVNTSVSTHTDPTNATVIQDMYWMTTIRVVLVSILYTAY